MANSAVGSAHSQESGLIRGLTVVDYWLGSIERLILGGSVLLMATLMSLHVLGRVFFQRGIPGTSEVTAMLIILITFVGVSYGVRCARHISMSAVYDQLSGWARKGLLVLICVGTGALMLYLAWESAKYTMTIYERGRVSASLRLPLWIIYLSLPVGFTLAGVNYWLTAIRNLTSDELYRSFTEKEEYAEVPVEDNSSAPAGNHKTTPE